MKLRLCLGRWLLAVGLAELAVIGQMSAPAAPTNVFSTQFESGEGYNPGLDLIGQGGWLGFGSGGNGLVSLVPGQGQQAYLGYTPPSPGGDQLVAWHPLGFDPLAAGLPLVKFSVTMSIVDSLNGNFDNFRWSAYNSQVHRLFSLDFDNYSTNISYLLDGSNSLVATTKTFSPGSNYTLLVAMNFAANRWSAALDNTTLVTNVPITTAGAALNLGDMDAVWLVFATNAPGDNFLLFDNYRVTAEALPVPVSHLNFLGRTSEGWTLLRLFGPAGSRWAVETTPNLLGWTALNTNMVADSYFDLVDTTASGLPARFYRARLIP